MSDFDRYVHLRSFESDYDHAQGTVRSTASLWILAAFAGFGYVFSAHLSPPITQSFLGTVVAWAAAFGLFVLWVIDQWVYQRLLHSVFVHGLYLEWHDLSLPQIRTKAYSDSLNISFKLSLFYLAPMIALLVIEVFFAFAFNGFSLPLNAQATSFFSDGVLILLLLSHLGIILYMYFESRHDRDLLGQHGELYPDTFKSYLHNAEYRTRLRDLFSK